MPGRRTNKILKMAADKQDLILQRLDQFEKLIDNSAIILSDNLLSEFADKLNVTDGFLTNDDSNFKKIGLVDRAFQLFREQQGLRILTVFVKDMRDIMNAGVDYYAEIINSPATSEQITEVINRRLGLRLSDGVLVPQSGKYIDSLIEDRTVQNDFKQLAFNEITSKKGYTSFRKAIKDFIVGGPGKPGKISQFYENFAYDTYSEVDRLNSSLHADRLKLTYFMYNGGIIRDSREFCKNHSGKVYTEDQAQEWKKLIGKTKQVPGKRKAFINVPIGPIVENPATYDPILNMGGIRCRHSADFISEEIAEELLEVEKYKPFSTAV